MKNYFPDMADMFRAVHMWTRFHHSMCDFNTVHHESHGEEDDYVAP